MDRRKRLLAVRRNANLSTIFRVLVSVCNPVPETLHRLNSRRRLGMNKHRQVEVAGGKHLSNHRQMFPDLLAAHRVVGIVGCDLDGATIVEEMKVVGSFLVAESHRLVAASVNVF